MQESTPLNQSPLSGNAPTAAVSRNESEGVSRPLWKQVVIGILVILRASISINIFLILPYIVIHKKGDYWNAIISDHIYLIPSAWCSVKWDIWQFYALTGILTVWGSVSILFLGGRRYYGPPTLSGYRPEYTHSGFRFYLLSITATIPLVAVSDVSLFYTEFVSLIAVLVLYAFIFSLFCYIKALLAPSNEAECKYHGNPMVDLWEGIELYPRIGRNLDLKTLITCRHCLFLLQIIYLVLIKANSELVPGIDWSAPDRVNWSMLTVTVLQSFYLAKWFYWEDGYKNTIDFIVERGGYYLMGACIALIPSLYSLYNLFLVTHSPVGSFGPLLFAAVTGMGIFDITCIYLADRQRQLCRDSDGKCLIWGREAEVLRVTYTDGNGKERKSLLLSSGFWGLSRHPNYFFEIIMFFIWSIPAVFSDWKLGLWYSLGTPLFVFLIMWDRSRKDDAKCKAKYGDKWDEYCQRVPYKIIPYVY